MEQGKNETMPSLDRIAQRIIILQEEINVRENEITELKDRIMQNHPVGSYQAGDLKVSIRPGARTINAKRFLQMFPPAEHPDLYQLKPDSGKARRQLGEDALLPVMDERKPTVVIS